MNSGFADRKVSVEFNLSIRRISVEFELLVADSAAVNTLGPIPFDISQSALSFPAGTSLRIVLTHRADSERLVSNDANAGYKLYIGKISIMTTYIKLSDPSLLALNHRLSTNSLSFPFLRTGLIGPSVIPTGVREHVWTITRGSCPELIMFGFAPVNFTDSAYQRNFLCFQHCDISFVQCLIGGLLFPSTALSPNFTTGEATLPIYLTFIECTKLFTDAEVSMR